MDRSNADPRNVNIDHDVGFIAGSSPSCVFMNNGVDVEMNVGIDEARNVIGMRCPGITYGCGSVRQVDSKDLGSCEYGVKINLVRAASIGASMSAESAVDAVAISTVASGAVVPRISDVEDREISVSLTPMTAAKNDLKNVSNVRISTEYMNVLFVPFHIVNAPPEFERAASASIIE